MDRDPPPCHGKKKNVLNKMKGGGRRPGHVCVFVAPLSRLPGTAMGNIFINESGVCLLKLKLICISMVDPTILTISRHQCSTWSINSHDGRSLRLLTLALFHEK